MGCLMSLPDSQKIFRSSGEGLATGPLCSTSCKNRRPRGRGRLFFVCRFNWTLMLPFPALEPQAACSALHSEHDRNATIVAMGMEDLAAKAT